MNRLQLETVSTIIVRLCIHPEVPAEQIIYTGLVLNDTRLRLDEISRFPKYPNAIDKLEESEAVRRVSVRKVLPKLSKLLGTLHHCLVSLTNDAIPLISSIRKREGVQVFCGFSIPLFIVLPLAQQTDWMFYFDKVITQSGADRFLDS